MLWDPNTAVPGVAVLNITGRCCMDFVVCTTPDDYADFSIRNTLDPETSPRASVETGVRLRIGSGAGNAITPRHRPPDGHRLVTVDEAYASEGL